MQATHPLPRRRPKRRALRTAQPRLGVWQDEIAGRFHPITVHQLAMAWWLYKEGPLTKRQLRIYFAAHEMQERRRYTKPAPNGRAVGRRGQGVSTTSRHAPTSAGGRKPLYTLDEVRSLIGSQDSDTALSADVKALGRLGLVKIGAHAIDFAVSIDQINIDELGGFWVFFNQLPNPGRTVPVPRRTVRALAAGFQPSVIGLMIALMIRSLFWHRREGQYRVDGRTKAGWVVEVFGLARRSVTEARGRLLELGWLSELESEQWQLNRYGTHDRIHVEAFGPRQKEAGEGVNACETARLSTDNSAKSASPCLNSSTSPSGNLNTRKPAPKRSGPAGGSRGKRLKLPALRNVVEEDLRDTERLLELHRQAVAAGHPVGGEAGRLDFLALAERARAAGNQPPRLFAWLLKHRRFEFIAQADEDRAAARLRELRDGPRQPAEPADETCGVASSGDRAFEALTEDERFVQACLLTAQRPQFRGFEPFAMARDAKGWDRRKWDAVLRSYEAKTGQVKYR